MSQSHREVLALHHQLEKILKEFIHELQKLEQYPSAFIPALDIFVGPENVHVFMDAPGLIGDQIKVSFASGILTIQGEKRFQQCEGRRHHLLERNFGTFYRVVHIREAVNALGAGAYLEQGVLHVNLPRILEKRKPVREIQVEER